MSWYDAIAYCEWLSQQTGKKFRLPTEAEWEYACRAGTITPFNTGENLTTDQANYKGQYRSYTKVEVDTFSPNSWGLYNMHGNAFEWCSDYYWGNYYEECKAKGVVENPAGPTTGFYRVLRGGCWSSDARGCRSAHRISGTPDDRNRAHDVGFRLVMEL